MPGASAAPAASRANKESTRASHRRFAEDIRHSPRGQVLTAYSTLSPAIGLFVTVPGAMREHCHRVDASVETSGPHGFAVRDTRIRLMRASRPPHLPPNVL